jgi:shikimate kinase
LVNNSNRNIILVGLSGSGKSEIGKRIGAITGKVVYDLDSMIESDQRMAVDDIIRTSGVDCFRRMEYSMLKKMLQVNDSVIVSGGGTVTCEASYQILKKMGTVIWLKAEIQTLVQRLSTSYSRPLLVSNPKDELVRQSITRSHLYEEADVIIDTTNLTIEKTVDEILSITKWSW